MTVSLIKATEQDAQLLHEIGVKSYRHHFAKLWLNVNELADYLYQEYSPQQIIKDIQTTNTEWFLIKELQQPIGLVKLTYHAMIPDESLCGTQLNKIYFLPDATGKGTGKTVFTQIETLTKQQNDSLLWLDVLAQNAHALRFYQANGMQKLKEVIFTSKTQQNLEFIMSKNL